MERLGAAQLPITECSRSTGGVAAISAGCGRDSSAVGMRHRHDLDTDAIRLHDILSEVDALGSDCTEKRR